MTYPTVFSPGGGTKYSAGFTLIELMIVCAIIAILAAVAYPSYRDSVLKGRRAEARAALTDLLQQQERFMTQNNTYKGFVEADAVPFKKFVGETASGATYKLSAGVCDESTAITECVRVIATPTGSDPQVGTLALRSTGQKTCSGTASSSNFRLCWP